MKIQRKWRRAWQRGKNRYYKGWWLRQKQQKALKVAQHKLVQRKKASRFASLVSPAAAAAIMLATLSGVSVADAANNNIVKDGRTGTTITDVNSKVTNITTNTIIGNGASGINSFLQFNVTAGNTVNMVLPTGASNLINLVTGGQSQINGITNSLKDGKIGGNLFFLNPSGLVVGAGGSINVGSLAVYTPTTIFMSGLLDGSNSPMADQFAQVIAGTLPIDSSGLISVAGSINTLNGAKFGAGATTIQAGGTVNVGALFDTSASTAADLFDSVVNDNGWGSAKTMARAEDGSIEIVAGDFINAGRLYNGGANTFAITNHATDKSIINTGYINVAGADSFSLTVGNTDGTYSSLLGLCPNGSYNSSHDGIGLINNGTIAVSETNKVLFVGRHIENIKLAGQAGSGKISLGMTGAEKTIKFYGTWIENTGTIDNGNSPISATSAIFKAYNDITNTGNIALKAGTIDFNIYDGFISNNDQGTISGTATTMNLLAEGLGSVQNNAGGIINPVVDTLNITTLTSYNLVNNGTIVPTAQNFTMSAANSRINNNGIIDLRNVVNAVIPSDKLYGSGQIITSIPSINTDTYNNIVTDGRTATTLTPHPDGNNWVTDVCTTTISGDNALNSFTYFNVATGNTVHLHVPESAINLINLVSGGQTAINGVLNSIKGGTIGGNVFFLNPNGMVMGTAGKINTGSLTVYTPPTAFVNGFFDSANNQGASSGNLYADTAAQVTNGTLPIDSGAAIAVSVGGTISATNDIKIGAGSLSNAGTISNRGALSIRALGDIVNTGTLTGSSLAVLDGASVVNSAAGKIGAGGLSIMAETGDFLNSGSINSGTSALSLRAKQSLTNNGQVNSSGSTTLNGVSIANVGTITVSNAANFGLAATGNFTNSGFIHVNAADSASLTAGGSLKNTVVSGQTNSGSLAIEAAKNVSITAGSGLENQGLITKSASPTGQDVFLISTMSGNITNSGKILPSAKTMTITAGAGNVVNSGVVDGRPADSFDLTYRGSLTNTGQIYGLKSGDTANNIVTDGNTITHLQYKFAGTQRVTEVYTESLYGENALNSFTYFNVAGGNIVNLYVPDTAKNLLNLVSGGQTSINGILNSIKGGNIGGNVYILNPSGLVVGANGSINAGSLNVYTPAKSFLQSFFDISQSGTTAINSVTKGSAGTASGTSIDVQGAINALDGIHLSADSITAGGKLIGGAVFSGNDKSTFRDVINTYGLNTPLNDDTVYNSDGNVELTAQKSVKLSTGAVLLSKSGSINVTATDKSEWFLTGIALPTTSASIEIADAVLQGQNINISADATSNSTMKPLDGDTQSSLGLQTLNSVVGVTPLGKMDDLIRQLTGMVVYQKADAKASVVVGSKARLVATGKADGAKIDNVSHGGDIDVTANATTSISVANKSSIAGIVLGLSDTEASVTVKNGARLEAKQNVDTVANTSNSVSLSTEVGSVNGDDGNKLNKKVPVNIGVSYLSAKSVTNAVIESGAVAIAQAGSVKVAATNTKEFSNEMITAGATDVLGAAVAISSSDTTTNALIAGSVEAAKDVSVSATIATSGNATSAESSVGGDGSDFTSAATDPIKEKLEGKTGAKKFSDALNDKIFGKATDKMPSFAQKLGVNASVAVALTNNDASAAITSTGSVATAGGMVNNTVKAGEKVSVGADVTAVANWGAVATQSPIEGKTAGTKEDQAKDITAAAAVIYANNSNKSNAYIADNAVVDAKKILNVTSKIAIPMNNSVQDMVDEVKSDDNWDKKLYSVVDFVKNTLGEDLGAKGFFTSWAQSSGEGETAALAASVNIRNFQNTNTVYIGKGAKINQNKVFLGNAAPIVTVSALNEITSIDLAGNFQFPLTSIQFWKKDSWQSMYGNTAGKAGIGGSVIVSLYDNTAKAYIDEGSSVYANILNVTADTKMKNISIAATGGKAGSLGIDASVSINQLNNITYANINKGALITTGGTTPSLTAEDTLPLGLSGDVVVKATDLTSDYNIVSGISSSSGVSIGAAVSYNNIARDTEASVSGNLAASGMLTTSAENHGTIVSGSLSMALSKDEKPGASDSGGGSSKNTSTDSAKTSGTDSGADSSSASDPLSSVASIASGVKVDSKATEDPLKSAGSKVPEVNQAGAKSGVSISGNVAINTIHDNTLAHVSDAASIKAKAAGVSSVTGGNIYAVSAAASAAANSGSASTGIAGAVMVNNVSANTKSYIDTATLVLDSGTLGNGLVVAAENDTGILTISLSGAGSAKGVGVAGQVSVNTTDNDTSAYLNNAEVSTSKATLITALDNAALVTVSGAVAYGGNAGIGASIAVNLMNNDNAAYITNSHVVGSTADSDLTVKAGESSKIVSVAAAAGISKGKMAAAMSASGNSLSNTTKAYITGGKAGSSAVDTKGSLAIGAKDDAKVTSIAGSGALSFGGGGIGFGASASVLITDNKVGAYIGDNTKIRALGLKDGLSVNGAAIHGLDIAAKSSEDVTTIAAAGAGGGTAGIAGSASVNVLTQNSDAHIGKNVVINGDNTAAGALQDVSVKAENTTSVTGLAGALAIGKTAGVGVGADVEVITGNTLAYIDSGAMVAAKNNVIVSASSLENVTSFAGSAAGGGQAGVAGTANAHVMNTDTEAFIGRAGDTITNKTTVNADGSVVVSAKDDSTLSVIAGSAAYGGSAGIGAAVGVEIVNKNTVAIIGDYASIQAKGLGSGASADLGTVNVTYTDYSANDISAPSLSTNGHGDIDNQGVSKKRISKAANTSIKGVAVTAVAQNTIRTIAAGASASGTAAISGSATVNVVNSTTSAHVGQKASINTAGGAGAEQSVLVAAGSDYAQLGVGGALAASGTVGIGAGAAVSVVNNTTTANIDNNAVVSAARDISVKAAATEDIISVAAALGASGEVGIAGAVTTNIFNNHTTAYLGGNALVTAGNNVEVKASDTTENLTVAGGAGIGLAAAGVGGSVDVTTIHKDTEAYIDSGAVVDANAAQPTAMTVYTGEQDSTGKRTTKNIKGVSVLAESSEKITDVVASGGAGLYAGVAGAVAVNIDASTTKAYVGKNSKLNTNNKNAGAVQAVSIGAVNDVKMLSVSGAAGGGLVGVAGGVDVGSIKNDTMAYVDQGSDVRAKGTVDVNALSAKNISSYAASLSGGGVGVSGSVSVYGIGANLGSDATNSLTAKKDAKDKNNPKENSVGEYADGQIDTSRYSNLLSQYKDSNIQNAGKKLSQNTSNLSVSKDINSTAVIPLGTSAFIRGNIQSGAKLSVNAKSALAFNTVVGAGSAGGVALGGAVSIINTGDNTTAFIDNNVKINAGSITVASNLLEQFTNTIAAGGIGLGGSIAGSVSVVNDNSSAKAYVVADNVVAGDTLLVAAKAMHTINDKVVGASAALAGPALAGAVLTANVSGSTEAYLGGVVEAAKDVLVDADTDTHLIGLVVAPSAGSFAGGAAVTTLTDQSITRAYVTGTLKSTGNLTIQAAYNPVIQGNSVGVGVGGIGIGAAVTKAEASGQVEASVMNNSSISAANIGIYAASGEVVYAETTAGAGGAVAVGGSSATVTDNVTTKAYTGSGVNLNTPQAVTIAATAMPKAIAEGKGYNFGALSVGVSFASASVNSSVDAHLGTGNSVNGKSLSILASLARPLAGDSVYANASASGGGLIGVNATESYAEEKSMLNSYVGDNSRLMLTGDVSITAAGDSNQTANSSAKTGGIIAVGANTSEAKADSTTIAYLGTGTVVDGKGTLSVVASGVDNTLATATSGSGGVIAGSAAKAKTKATSNTKAYIGAARDKTQITVNTLNLSAKHTGTVNSNVDSMSASVAGGSGASGENIQNAGVTATLNGTINTKNLVVKAINNLLKPVRVGSGYNVEAGSGGLLNGAAASENSVFIGSTLITIGDGANIKVNGDKKKPGDTIFEALTNVDAVSKTRLVAGGAIEIAKAEANMLTNTATSVNMGKGVSLDSVGDVTLAAYTTLDTEAAAGVNVWGLAGGAQGATSSTVYAGNTVSVDADSAIRVDGDINLYAGRSAGGETNVFTIKANTDLYNNSVIPINGSPRADVGLNQSNTINLVKGSSLRSVADVNLLAEAGSVSTVGYGYAQDMYRKALESVASAFSNLFGGGDVSFATEYHSAASPAAITVVNVDGSVETGIQNKQYLLIEAIKEGDIKNFSMDPLTGNGQAAFSVKTTSTEGVSYTITKENLANNLLEYRKKLVNLKNEYAADQKAAAAYASDIAYVDSQLDTMGLIIKGANGTKIPLESYDVYYLTVNDVQARGGNINVTAGKLTGSGSLGAPKDSSITIINNSPLYLRTNQLLLDNTGGHVNFNGVEVTSNQEITKRNQGNIAAKLAVSLPRGESVVSVTPSINTVTVGSTNGVDSFTINKTYLSPTTAKIAATTKPIINLQNNYTSALYSGTNLNKLFASAPNIQVSDSITNSAGSVSIYNAEGSILLQGENGSSPTITANEVHIDTAKGSVYQSYTPGLTSIGGNPESLWTQAVAGLESTNNKTPSTQYNTTVSGHGGIYSNGGVYISGQYLNINGTIQSGVGDWNLSLNGSAKYSGTGNLTLEQFISAKQAEWAKLGKDPNTKYQISTASAENGTIASYYNPSTGQIELDGVTVQGGRVELYGQIMNTGGGNIQALDGYGNIKITNNTNYNLLVNTLDTGNNLHGIVKITDTGKIKTINGQAHYLITQYERNAAGQVQTTTSHSGLNDAVTTLSSTATRSADGGYSPVAGTRYVWTLGQDKTTTTYEHFDHRVGAWGWDPFGWVTSDSDRTSSNTITNNLTALPGGAYAVVDTNSGAGLVRTYKNNVLSRMTSEYKSSYRSGFLSWYKHYVTDKVTKEGSTDVYTYSAKADYAIGIGFGGYDAGSNAGISVSGTGKGRIILNNSLTSRGGAVTVSAASSAITSSNTDAVIAAKSINLSAGGLYNGLGKAGAPLAVKLLGDAGSLTAITAAGDINLKGVSGDLRITSIDTYANSKYGKVTLNADGSILQAVNGDSAVIRGSSINLTSAAGSIGTASQALNVSVMGTGAADSINATAAKDISLRQPNGDFRLGHIESLSGDVTVEAANGSLVDANPIEKIDSRTLDEMNALWDRMQVRQGTGANAANSQALTAYANNKQAMYFDYWRMRNVTAVYDDKGNIKSYTADAYNPNYTYTATDSDKAMFAQAGMTAAEQAAYIDQKTKTYLSVSKELGSSAVYNENYTYAITDTDRANLTTKGWSDSQLKYSINLGIAKQTVSTDTTLQDPNVTGRQVKLLAKKGGIGKDNGEMVINPNDRNVLKDIYNADGTVTPSAARLALASAEGDDITIDKKNQIHVALRKAIYVNSGTLEAVGRDHVYIGSASPIYVKGIQSGSRVNDVNGAYDGSIRIKGKAGLYDVSTSGKAALQGVSAGDYLTVERASYVAAQSAYAEAQNNLTSAQQAKQAGEAAYTAMKSKYNANAADYEAASQAYQAAKKTWDNLSWIKKLSSSAVQDWTTAQKNWTNAQTNWDKAQNDWTIAQNSWVTAQNSWTGAQAAWNAAESTWNTATSNWNEAQIQVALKGGRTIIEAGYNGSLGTKDAPLSLKLAEGAALTARAAGSIYLDSKASNLYLAEVYSEGDVWLHAPGSILTNTNTSINSVATQGKTITFMADTGTLGTADRALLVNADALIASGESAVLEGQVNNSVQLNSNKVTLRNLYSTGTNPLSITLAGYGKAMADLANITVTAPKGVNFNSLTVDNATIKAYADNLSLYNTNIGVLASFSNKYYTAIVGSNPSSSQWGNAGLVLSTQNKPFYLLMMGNQADTNTSMLKAGNSIKKVGQAANKDNNVAAVMGNVMSMNMQRTGSSSFQQGISVGSSSSLLVSPIAKGETSASTSGIDSVMQFDTPQSTVNGDKDKNKDKAGDSN